MVELEEKTRELPREELKAKLQYILDRSPKYNGLLKTIPPEHRQAWETLTGEYYRREAAATINDYKGPTSRKAKIDIFDYQCCRCKTITKNVKVEIGGPMPSWNCGKEGCGGTLMIVKEKRKDDKRKWRTTRNEFIPDKVEEPYKPLIITEDDFERLITKFKNKHGLSVPIPIEWRGDKLRDTLNFITYALEDKLGKRLYINEEQQVWIEKSVRKKRTIIIDKVGDVPGLTDEEIEQYFDANWNVTNKPPDKQKIYNAVCEERKKRDYTDNPTWVVE